MIYKLNIINTLTIYKNIIEIKKFKKLIMFKIIFEKNKRILKSNNSWIKNIAIQRFYNAKNLK